MISEHMINEMITQMALKVEMELFSKYIKDADSFYLIHDEPLNIGRLNITIQKSDIEGLQELVNEIHVLRSRLLIYINIKNGGVNVGGLKQDPNYTKLKEKYKEIEQILKTHIGAN